MAFRRMTNDIQKNDILKTDNQKNGILENDIHQNNTEQNDAHQNDTLANDSQHSDIQQNDIKVSTKLSYQKINILLNVIPGAILVSAIMLRVVRLNVLAPSVGSGEFVTTIIHQLN